MTKPVWMSLAAIGIGEALLRRFITAGEHAFDTKGLLAEVESIIDFHAPKPEADAVAKVREIEQLRGRIDALKDQVVIG